jgi:predicted small secreted protein
MKSITKLAMLGMLMLAIGFISGCNTMNGFGQDVSSAGHGISRAAS